VSYEVPVALWIDYANPLFTLCECAVKLMIMSVLRVYDIFVCFHVVTITQVKVKVKGKSVFIFFFYMLNLLSIGDQSRLTISAKLSLMSSIESIETSRSPPS